MTYKNQLLSNSDIQGQDLDISLAPAMVTVAFLQFLGGKAAVRWGVTSWRVASELAALLKSKGEEVSLYEASEFLRQKWTPLPPITEQAVFTDAEALHFYRVPVQKEVASHGRWIESVCDLSRVRLEFIETLSPRAFSVCFFYRIF